MLSSILSDAASQLYGRLIDGERIIATKGTNTDPNKADSPAAELVTHGLAALSDRGETVLVPVNPSTAHATLLAGLMTQMEQFHRRLTDSYEEFREIQSRYASKSSAADSDLVELLTDTNQIILLSREMVAGASEEVLAFVTEQAETEEKAAVVVPSSTESLAHPRIRSVYTPGCLNKYQAKMDESVAAGEEARLYAGVPTKMNIVGRSQAMVALDRTGLHATLFIRSRPLINALRLLFELVWERATPYPAAAHDDALSPQEQRVIALLATGAKDEAIARQLDVTVRTVRRHITAAMTKLGAENRFAAGVLATKRGWI